MSTSKKPSLEEEGEIPESEGYKSSSESIVAEEYTVNQELIAILGQYFQGLEDEDMVAIINNVLVERAHLVLESQMFTDFLSANEPSIIEGLPSAIVTIKELEKESPLLPSIFDVPTTEQSDTCLYFSEIGPRINCSYRTDLVLRYMEEMEESLDEFQAKTLITKFNLKASIEESSLRIEETNEGTALFESSMANAVDPQSQRIPAEKFVWFLEEWLKGTRLITEKVRLRNNSLKIQYQKLKAMVDFKSDLRTKLHAVDLDQLIIENKYLKNKIDTCNMNLIELKHFHCAANIDLAFIKRNMLALDMMQKYIKQAIRDSEEDTVWMRAECEITAASLAEVKAYHDRVKRQISTCKAPEIMDYVRAKAKFDELLKVQKVLARKGHLLKITADSTLKSLLSITGRKRPKKEWFLRLPSEELDEDFALPRPSLSDTSVTSEYDIFKVIHYQSPIDEKKLSNLNTTKTSILKSPKRRLTSKKLHSFRIIQPMILKKK